MSISVYNTLSRQKEEFQTIEPKKVKMYVCGPTTYDHSHIGHMRTFAFFDVVRRWLEYRGYDVTMLINITDIDDKTIRRANEEGVSFAEIADRYMFDFIQALRSYNIRLPNAMPKATSVIADMYYVIQTLIDKGYAYIAEDGVYFDISKFEDYGKLSGQKREFLLTGVRIEPSPHKRNAGDFALWKKRKEGEPFWHAPWMEGRPGWHIECSTMIWKYLGDQIDIHGGGTDLIFPHHENEIAQSEAFTGKKPFVKYWMHVGMLKINGEKMSKSLGNFIRWFEALEMAPAAAWRFYYATNAYRQPMNITEDGIRQAHETAKRVYRAEQAIRYAIVDNELGNDEFDPRPFMKRFSERMDDDFDTPGAVAAMMDFINAFQGKIYRLSPESARETLETLRTMMNILGLPEMSVDERTRAIVDEIVELRGEMRQERRYNIADKIRAELAKVGIELHDGKTGTRWFVVP